MTSLIIRASLASATGITTLRTTGLHAAAADLSRTLHNIADLSAYMAIQKHEFYEGAALHQLIRGCGGAMISYVSPFFQINDRVRVYLKYSTGVRSPWGFTFMPEEQRLLTSESGRLPIVIGLVCGSDGVAAITSELFLSIARPRDVAIRVACARRHREHFEVSGPHGVAPGKIPPSNWQRLLSERPREDEAL
jgi:hypothetical protein